MLPLIGFALEQFVQWKFGMAGAASLLLLTIGVKARNSTCATIGAVVLALLLVQPATG
ncbi:hypothetical protein [Streptomyces sp. NPDC058653]|uniref:hypothetical protein n=1 Tax=Streptomyces sp. NPDC058653 TaxID=3346576 RepID=UPI00364907A7